MSMPRNLSWTATNSGIFILRGRHKSVLVDDVRKLWTESFVHTLVPLITVRPLDEYTSS